MTAAAINLSAEDVAAAIGRPVRSVRRSAWDYHTSHAMQQLDVELADSSVVPMMFKDLAPEHQLPEAIRTRPAFLYNPRREIDVYRDLLALADLDTPAFYGADTGDRRWLFIERVENANPLWECDLDQWPQAARWLKRFHTTKFPALPPTLLRYDADFYCRWLRRAAEFRPEVSRIEKGYAKVIDRLTTMPAIFIHGEFYPSNILVQQRRIRPVDWETAAVGPALMDVAALCSGKLDDTTRRAVAEIYGADTDALDHCRLHLAIQWLGWSADWQPPKEHAQNWLAEALELAAKVGAL